MISIKRWVWAFWTLVVPICIASLYGPLAYRHLTVLGVLRRMKQTPLANPGDIAIIQDTIHCEDLHYHQLSQSIFTACEDTVTTRFSWFPPVAVLDDPAIVDETQGSIHVISLETLKSRRLNLKGFNSPFVTHGIDVIADPASVDESAVFIFAVNHVPNTQHIKTQTCTTDGSVRDTHHQKSDSRVEIFHHILGSDSAHHIRTIRHSLITTPNDIIAVGPTNFFVTNDHYYREGLMRQVEDLYFGAKWSNIIHIQLDNNMGAEPGIGAGINASVALSRLHNNNGLGRGPLFNELLIGSAVSGRLHIAQLPGDAGREIEIVESIDMDSTIDNPTYFSDPFANSTYDASGYVVGGFARAIDIPRNVRDPLGKDGVMIWHVKRKQQTNGAMNEPANGRWEKRLLFEDDGERIRSASTALLVAIDPQLENGDRKAWLFLTGPWSENMISVKVNI
ncbi:hypothetical protein B0J13DRAFT_573982 [Dactylonectria estremocensis]|uniref:Serum paraoxonase/arylesterase family protein n=1 Tax=Dactylonectria estremocensis TaxID=1079267 RepID=A0A9P9D7Q6_9HYPO|nr:hypothetical protein B0J13DRAFT_573982 [Dactylonectria estremocensis]